MPKTGRVKELTSHQYAIETDLHREAARWSSEVANIESLCNALERDYGMTGVALRLRRLRARRVNSVYELATRRGSPILYIATTRAAESGEAELELRHLLIAQSTASFAVLAAGRQITFLRRRHDALRCEYTPDLPKRCQPSCALDLFAEPSTAAANASSSDALENRFFEAHSAIRDLDGMHDDEALDELCKLLYTLQFRQSAEGIIDNTIDAGLGSSHPVEAAALLRESYNLSTSQHTQCSTPGDAFSLSLRLSDASLLRAWRALSEIDLRNTPGDLKGRAFQRVLDPAIRAGMGQFFTPTPVVDFMVRSLSPRLTDRVLDPFAGSGHFLHQFIDFVVGQQGAVSDRSSWTRTHIHGIERSERMIRIARTDELLRRGDSVSLHCNDALAPFRNLPGLEPASFDIVVTNPPFGSLLGVEALSSLGPFTLTSQSGSTPLDVLGLERSIEFLKEGGKLAIVLPEGIFSNRRMRRVREWLRAKVRVVAIVSLPVVTFAPFGANVRTYVLFAKKSVAKCKRAQSVIVAGIDDIGYDASGRRSRAPDDLCGLVAAVRANFD